MVVLAKIKLEIINYEHLDTLNLGGIDPSTDVEICKTLITICSRCCVVEASRFSIFHGKS
jgi:hypothetical protein